MGELPSRKYTLRFAVGSPDGPRSGIYSLWAQDAASGRATRSDVYLASRTLGGIFKVSLHQDGCWQWSLTKQFFDKGVRVPGWSKDGRHAVQWYRPPEFHPRYTLAFSVRFPTSELRHVPLGGADPKRVAWLAPAGSDEYVDVVTILARGHHFSGWPGMNTMGTQLLTRIALESGETLFVVHNSVPMTEGMLATVSKLRIAAAAMAGESVDPSNPVYRLQLFGSEDSGVRFFIDASLDREAAT